MSPSDTTESYSSNGQHASRRPDATHLSLTDVIGDLRSFLFILPGRVEGSQRESALHHVAVQFPLQHGACAGQIHIEGEDKDVFEQLRGQTLELGAGRSSRTQGDWQHTMPASFLRLGMAEGARSRRSARLLM